MFTVRVEYTTHIEVFGAAKYTVRNNIMNLYAPRTETAYVLPGSVVQEVHLTERTLQMVYVMNGLGKTVETYWPSEEKKPRHQPDGNKQMDDIIAEAEASTRVG